MEKVVFMLLVMLFAMSCRSSKQTVDVGNTQAVNGVSAQKEEPKQAPSNSIQPVFEELKEVK